MYSMLLDVWNHVQSLKPAFISKSPHFNFITVHYFWIIGMVIFGSICLYPVKNITYIDALFIASGAATQSGLNTVDINSLNTFQQIILYFVPMLTNPITINSSVVFLRLYWFEKRFQHIAQEAKKGRRSIAKTFSKARTDERDLASEEMGVNGRDIVVMHKTAIPNGMTNGDARPGDLEEYMAKERMQEDTTRSSGDTADTSQGHSSRSDAPPQTAESIPKAPTQIKFADQVKRSNGEADEPLRMPVLRSHEEHIAILERQRKQDDGAVLRIPGPRDADAGIDPETLDDSDPLKQVMTRRSLTFGSHRGSMDAHNLDSDDHTDEENPTRPRNITIAEPIRSPAAEHMAEDVVAAKHTLGALRFRKPRMFKPASERKIHENSHDHPLHPTRSRAATFQTIRSALTGEKDEGMPYLSWEPTVGRNSAFVDLSESQREELGGIEYRSLKSLALILTVYFWGFTIFGVVCLLPWIMHDARYTAVVDADGQGKVWWGIFTANSAFTDLGYTLTPDSMLSFAGAIWPLLLMSFLIIIGNTGFPIMLRIIIWVTSKYVPKDSGIWEELKFLLDHPRRCFTLLFPSQATWWLFWILVILNAVDLLFFVVLDLGNTVVTDLPVNIRVLDGWFQAVSTRTAGFAVVNLANLHPAIQVSYLVMMYISVLPIAISVRRTNVYEERSLGIYGKQTEENEDEGEPSYVGAHLRRQLSFDLWYIFLGLFIISISEGSRIQSGDPAFTLFSILFEIVSAYGTVGLSLGYTNINASFSAEFGVIGKLVIIAMQIRGRHRGLPYELDKAILLPSEHLEEKEAADATLRVRTRRNSNNIRPVSSAAGKTERSLSRQRTSSQNFLSTLLHPGPTIPNSHRNGQAQHTDLAPVSESMRRQSIATTGRSARSVSPRAMAGIGRANSQFGIPLDDVRRGRTEGRRSFQEGVNPPLAPAPAPAAPAPAPLDTNS
ncbi:Low-affinity potassium transport protein [Lachnellula subtilissima]|uniref:Potassium transport protein n=1 Tax=Lachnellula subtilissima TaxID=602034 RepID=A0A8H8UF26_9HELO|nr:Low-affinity potassium transport protein [Lachnellula subtilissima]